MARSSPRRRRYAWENREHKSGVTFHLAGMKAAQFLMEWSPVDNQARRSHNDLQEATERGAYGIAILIVCDLTGMVVVERSAKGPGFDYWLGNEDEDDASDELFAKKARLEVSGILSSSRSQAQARVRGKREQMKPSDRLAPGYVAVVEFGTPIACVETV